MKRARIVAPQTVTVENTEIQPPAPNEVSVATEYCGICGSDLHAYFGRHPFMSLPVVPGHECSGRICEIGEDVRGLSVGQRVTVIPQLVCGKCYNCRTGRYNICEQLKVIGCQTDGALAERFNVESRLVLPLPDTLGLSEGSLIEPVAVAVHAVKKSLLKEGDRVAILGSGTIGLCVLQYARSTGASEILITDISDYKLSVAQKLGADHLVNVMKANPAQIVEEKFSPHGVDLVFECVGSETTIGQAIQLARKGTKIMVVGVFERPAVLDVGLIQDRELELVGSLMYLREDFRDAMKAIETGSLKVKPLISKIYNIDQAAEAFLHAATHKDKVVKVLIRIPKE